MYEAITRFGWVQEEENGVVNVYVQNGMIGIGQLPKELISCEFSN